MFQLRFEKQNIWTREARVLVAQRNSRLREMLRNKFDELRPSSLLFFAGSLLLANENFRILITDSLHSGNKRG